VINRAKIVSIRNMKKKIAIINLLLIYLFSTSIIGANTSNYLEEGIKLYNKKEFEKSKIFFEKDIVYDPRSENSYLYLAKIFNEKEDIEQEEINLNNVLLLNPDNDEAIYMLIILKLEQSDYDEAKNLLDTFLKVCNSFCTKKAEIEEKLKKLTPENANEKN